MTGFCVENGKQLKMPQRVLSAKMSYAIETHPYLYQWAIFFQPLRPRSLPTLSFRQAPIAITLFHIVPTSLREPCRSRSRVPPLLSFPTQP